MTIAKDALAERGFSELEILVAKQIVDPDPTVRLALAKALPNIGVNDPRPWLLWLSHDLDADVRRATVAILATNPDPALQDRLLELELKETNESVLDVVKQALEQRRRRQ
jgi:HEAT repeat protein